MKNALLATLMTMLAASSGCCGALAGAFCCHDSYAYGGGCGDCGSCDSGCGDCGSCGTYAGGGIIDWLFACNHGDCGPTYWGEFSDKPDLCDPCDGCGNWTGQDCYGGGCGDGCGGCGSNYYPYNSGYGGSYSQGFEGEYDGAVSDVQVREGPSTKSAPTPAAPRAVEPIPTPGNRSSQYQPRSGNRRVSYDTPQHHSRPRSRNDLRR